MSQSAPDNVPAEVYRYSYHMGFGDCDPAGIAYTGALVNAALRAIDRFLGDVTAGRGWYAMSVSLGAGMPFAHLDVDFVSPVRGDADLDFTVEVTRLGQTSIGFRATGWQRSEACFSLNSVNVFISRGEGKQPLPDWLRAALAPYLA
ncbi:acyl-CoA thioesterase [Paracoccus niistensis]|uniref:Acyl-CoA thioesterase n=1 Tax=Paracoccus niistensis TaxID=632935 RepID=A0ABV6I8C5_9RHOB